MAGVDLNALAAEAFFIIVGACLIVWFAGWAMTLKDEAKQNKVLVVERAALVERQNEDKLASQEI